MHKRKSDFNPLKFTPSYIHNKLNLDRDVVIEYFQSGHPLADCAEHFKCSAITIKRKLKSWGVDTSIYNHSDISVKRSRAASMKGKTELSDAEIISLYIDNNLDTKTIAEMTGLHYQTIRMRVHKLRLQKDRKKVAQSMMSRYRSQHGYGHPAQHPDTLKKTRRSTIRISYINISSAEYTFRSLHELSYALYLDSRNDDWTYEEMRVPYVDMLTGKHRIYIIDFTIIGDVIQWVEVKPNELMIPEDKRIYAERMAEEAGIIYRGTTKDERTAGWQLLTSGYRLADIHFLYPKPRKDQNKITYWFKSESDANDFIMAGWKTWTKTTKEGVVYKKVMVRQ